MTHLNRLPGQAATWLVAAALLLAAVPSSALAQDAAERAARISIGLILPAPVGSDDPLTAAVRDAAREGAEMAVDELAMNATMLGYQLEVRIEEASDPDAAAALADAMFEEGAVAVAGGWSAGTAEALAASAERHDAVFLNVGSPADRLRNETCSAAAFHVVPSAGMYLDALAGWFVREGFRDWFFVVEEDDEGAAQLARIRRALQERHFAARIVGEVSVGGAGDVEEAASRAARANADLIVVLAPTRRQLDFLAAAEQTDVQAQVTGFPWPEAQTRDFYRRWGETAPTLGAGFRASAWEATLDAYGARELNARFAQRAGEPMNAPAWATYIAVKMVIESVTFGQAEGREGLRDHLVSQQAVFDVWKGIGVTFRPWNHQLRQSVFLIQVVPDAETPRDAALLVGELPSIYMPRTDPVERLDQLGDLEGATRCRF